MKSTLVITSLASLGAASVVPSGSYPIPSQKSCPAPGTTDANGNYLCNPAHQYPSGQTCVFEDGCYYLRSTGTTVSSETPEPTYSSCPAPGTTDANGNYLCNPAHQYPSGQTCIFEDGCYYLRSTGTTASSQTPEPTYTSCPAPGTTTAAGQYSCNPAHQYPTGQTCQLFDGCYFLVSDEDCSTTTPSVPEPTQTSCAPPGTTNDKGEYMCNPAHAYPEGQTCQFIDGCYVLKGDEEDCTTTSSAGPKPTGTACPAPGSYDAAGRYMCNPAHQYPAGQTCQFIEGCYRLVVQTTSSAPAPQPTAACPAPGTTNSNGDYLCNPAHQYPAGQTCILVNGCYVLRGTSMSTTVVVPPRPTGANNGTQPALPTYVPGAAAGLKASSMSVMASLMAIAYFVL